MRIVVAGGGYVGLSTATGFARQGHDIELVEIDGIRAKMLAQGQLPFREPSLAGAFAEEVSAGSIRVHHGYRTLGGANDVAFICTSTPPTSDGSLDTSQVFQAAEMLAAACESPLRLAIRSTVNPGTTERLEEKMACGAGNSAVQLVFNPEFLREGSGLDDFERPSRVVIGGTDQDALDAMEELYSFADGVPLLRSDSRTAELIKLAANAALAVRVSMANEIAQLADRAHADVDTLLEGIGCDPRIGQHYLKPGIGFGGSCLPKDLAAFRSAAQQIGFSTPVFDGASLTNDTVVGRLASRAVEVTNAVPWPRVAVAGVGFKPGSDSLRNSQAVRLVRTLLQRGLAVTLYDPLAENNARQEFHDSVEYADSFEMAVAGSDVAIVLDPSLIAGAPSTDGKVVIDATGRRIYPGKLEGETTYGRR